jgi:hypothetical protein
MRCVRWSDMLLFLELKGLGFFFFNAYYFWLNSNPKVIMSINFHFPLYPLFGVSKPFCGFSFKWTKPLFVVMAPLKPLPNFRFFFFFFASTNPKPLLHQHYHHHHMLVCHFVKLMFLSKMHFKLDFCHLMFFLKPLFKPHLSHPLLIRVKTFYWVKTFPSPLKASLSEPKKKKQKNGNWLRFIKSDG